MSTTCPHLRPPSRRRAFTLVEMLCVLTILGITGALVVPLINNTNDMRLAAAQRKLLADLQYAQGMAVATRKSVYVRCAADRYELCTLAGTSLAPMRHPIEPGPYVVRFGPAAPERALRGVALAVPTFGFADRTLGFDATGVPFAFNDQTNARTPVSARSEFKLDAAGASRQVYVEAFTGELRVP